MEHISPIFLAPMFPPVLFDMFLLWLAITINILNCSDAHTVFVDPWIVLHAILSVKGVNLAINPVYFVFLVVIILRFWAVISEPGELGRIEEGSYCDSVRGVVVIR